MRSGAQSLRAGGTELFNRGRFAEALAAFDRALARDRGASDLEALAAHSLEALGRREEARRRFAGLLRRAPECVPAALGLSGLLRARGDLRAALRILRPAFARRPDDPALRGALAGLLRERALECKAADAWQACRRLWAGLLRLEPGHEEARRELEALLWKLAQKCQAADRLDEAARYCRAVLKFRPDDERARAQLSAMLWKRARRARPKAGVSRGSGAGNSLRLLAALRRLNPERVDADLETADILRVQGRLEAEERFLWRAWRRRPGENRITAALKRCLLGKAARLKSQKRGPQAAAAWRSVLRVDPGDAAARSELRAAALRAAFGSLDALRWEGREQGRWRAALEKTGKATDPRERLQRFRLLAGLGRYEEAFEEGERILDTKPGLEVLRIFWHPWARAQMHRLRARHRDHLSRIIARSPDNPWAYYYRGVLGEGGAAQADLLKAASFPRARYGWMMLRAGWALLQNGSFSRALRLLRAARRAAPAEWQAHGHMAEAYLCLGRRGRAMAELRRAERVVPPAEAGQVAAWRAGLELWSGRYRQALAHAERACAQGAPYAFCWRGAALVKLGDAKGAVKLLDETIRRYPHDREAYVWRGEALRLAGSPRRALRDLSREPVGTWASFNRALLHGAGGRPELMRRDFLNIPATIRDWISARLRLSPRREWDPASMRRVLKAGLDWARGWRREESYGRTLWMWAGKRGRR